MAETRSYYTRQDLATFARRYGRQLLSRMIAQQTAFAGSRQYYGILGYPKEIEVTQYAQRYARQDIAGRVVDLPAKDTWKNLPVISEDGNTETEFVRAWEALVDKRDLGLRAKLSRADRLSGVGRFGILLIGVRDGAEELSEPVNDGELNDPDDLLYLRPLPEGDTQSTRVKIHTWNEDPQSERFGLPESYEVQLKYNDEDMAEVHWSRVIHLAEGRLDDDVHGTPRLERVFNRLDDLIKLVGGSAEATWLNMRPGTLLRPMEGYDLDMSSDEIEDELENYVHDPMRMLMLEGVEAESLGTSEVVDVEGPFGVILSLIAAASGIPQRVLVGSAQGELSAAKEDMRQWAGAIAERQQNYAEPEILRPFIDRLCKFGVLPTPPNGYQVEWPKLVEMSDEELAEIMARKANAVKALSDPMASYPIEESERRELLGFPPREASGAE
jgi:hypothetical protein